MTSPMWTDIIQSIEALNKMKMQWKKELIQFYLAGTFIFCPQALRLLVFKTSDSNRFPWVYFPVRQVSDSTRWTLGHLGYLYFLLCIYTFPNDSVLWRLLTNIVIITKYHRLCDLNSRDLFLLFWRRNTQDKDIGRVEGFCS